MAAQLNSLLTLVGKESHASPSESKQNVQSDPIRLSQLEPIRPPSNEDLESSPPGQTASVLARQRWNDPNVNIGRICTACLILFINGMNDSAPGALLPSIEAYYNINYILVSMIFVCNAVGFIAAAFWVHALDRKIGRASTLMLNEALTISGYVLLACVPPFAVFALAYVLTGIGMATNLALNNVFVANLADSNKPLSILHASYGLGGLLAPIFATSMVSNGIPFQRFFIIMLGLRALSFCLSGIAFWNFEENQVGGIAARPSHRVTNTDITTLQPVSIETAQGLSPSRTQKLRSTNLGQSLGNKNTLAASLFIFAYQGAEVAISGWVISFLITTRGGDPDQVGYVTAGFWGGITFGRLVLNLVAPYVGEGLFVFLLVAGSAAFQLVLWFAPNIIADAVATAMLGVLLGPVYPSSTAVFAHLLPRELQNSSLAFISSAGSSGGALAPFLVGLIAQGSGTYVLHPICIALYAVMGGCWLILTRGYRKRRTE